MSWTKKNEKGSELYMLIKYHAHGLFSFFCHIFSNLISHDERKERFRLDSKHIAGFPKCQICKNNNIYLSILTLYAILRASSSWHSPASWPGQSGNMIFKKWVTIWQITSCKNEENYLEVHGHLQLYLSPEVVRMRVEHFLVLQILVVVIRDLREGRLSREEISKLIIGYYSRLFGSIKCTNRRLRLPLVEDCLVVSYEGRSQVHLALLPKGTERLVSCNKK